MTNFFCLNWILRSLGNFLWLNSSKLKSNPPKSSKDFMKEMICHFLFTIFVTTCLESKIIFWTKIIKTLNLIPRNPSIFTIVTLRIIHTWLEINCSVVAEPKDIWLTCKMDSDVYKLMFMMETIFQLLNMDTLRLLLLHLKKS